MARAAGDAIPIRSQVVPSFLAWMQALGGDAGAIAKKWGLPPDVTSMREIVVDLSTVHGLTDDVARALGDANLGLHIGLRLPRGSYGLIELVPLPHSPPAGRLSRRQRLRRRRRPCRRIAGADRRIAGADRRRRVARPRSLG